MGTIDCIYIGVIGIFSVGCIIYGIRLAIKTRKYNINQYKKSKERRKKDFENYGTRY